MFSGRGGLSSIPQEEDDEALQQLASGIFSKQPLFPLFGRLAGLAGNQSIVSV